MGRGVVLCVLVVCAIAFSGAVSAATQEQQLATLAGFMLNISTALQQDYTMSCGPASEVLESSTFKSSVCVMVLPSQVIIGTAGSEKAVAGQFLESMNQSPHLGAALIKNIQKNACDSVFGTSVGSGFTECRNAFTLERSSTYIGAEFSAYVYEDNAPTGGAASSPMYFVLVSDHQIPGATQSKTFFTKLIDFFKGLFGWSG
jgi:hypothetical protein